MNVTAKRLRYVDAILSANNEAWPDLEGLIRDIYVSYLREGDVALDVGVNHGTHLFQMAEAVGGSGCVIGVEAVPAHVEAVHANLQTHYRHLAERIEIHSCAVSCAPGRAEFFVSRINDGGLSGLHMREVLADTPVEKIEVEVTTLDRLIGSRPSIQFVKIDIEGAEFDALSGSPRLLEQRPVIVFEFDETAPPNFHFAPDEFMGLFWRNNFGVYDIFGFPVESGEALMEARVWNFVAVPEGLDAVSITGPARRTLESQFPTLRDISPV